MGVHNVVAQIYCKDWFEGCVVHHKDNNQHNNNANNLECLNLSVHTKLHNSNKYFDVKKTCPECGNIFIWTAKAQSHYKRNKTKNGPFCSKKCASKYTYKYTENMKNSKFNSKNKKPEEYWNSKKIYCVETDTVYPSAGEASRQLNIKSNFIRMVANKQRNSAHGLHFKFV